MRCTCPALVLALVHLLEPCAGAIVTTGYWPVPLARFYTAGVANSLHEKCSQPDNGDYNASEWPGWNNTGYDTGNDDSTTGNTAALCKTICQDTHNAATMEYIPGNPNDSSENNYCCCAGIGFTAEEKAGPYCMYHSDKVPPAQSEAFDASCTAATTPRCPSSDPAAGANTSDTAYCIAGQTCTSLTEDQYSVAGAAWLAHGCAAAAADQTIPDVIVESSCPGGSAAVKSAVMAHWTAKCATESSSSDSTAKTSGTPAPATIGTILLAIIWTATQI